jgi:hypothetical protein
MDLIINTFRKEDDSLIRTTSYPNGGGYKTVKELQKALIYRWRNKRIHEIIKIDNGIRYNRHTSLTYQDIFLIA